MERLRDEKGADLKDLRRLFDRLVTVALRISGTPAANALSVLPGGRWAALVAADGSTADAAPESSSGAEWCTFAPKLMKAADAIRALFGARPVTDIVLRIEEGTRRVIFGLIILGVTALYVRITQERQS